jgi:hypothetical protein
MILQKKQVYLNKVLSKHYKTLRYIFFDKTQNIPALKTTAIAGAQSIGISILTIDTISHKDFPSIIDVTVLNGLRKTKKAVIIYEGQTTISTTFTRSISKFTQRQPLTQKPEDTGNVLLLSNLYALHSDTLLVRTIDRMLGAGVRMYHYNLYFNSLLSLQHLDVLRRKQKIKLKNLDRLAASLILPEHTSELKTKNITVQGALKRKEIKLSKMELSSIIVQVLHKTRNPFSKQELLGFSTSVFTIKKLSNVLGALVEINSKIYFISDKELKQCGLAGGLNHSTFNSSTFHNNSKITKLKHLINSKMTRDKEILLRTKNIEPNIIFFNFLNIAVRTYAIHNIKKIFSKLVNILSRLV